jgi:ribA/ribD-fused uncharacterized protein
MIQYITAECATFWRSRDEFGGFHNMAGGYPITIGQYRATSEHIYQVMRFPHDPALQERILAIPNALMAKRLAHQHLAETRADWRSVRSDIMHWSLELKLSQHAERFGALLRSTGDRSIVEASSRDDYWGAKPVANGTGEPVYLRGWNVLGRLLWLMRRRLEIGLSVDLRAPVIDLPNFRLGGEDALALALD